jgi:riboflavin kinase / FMN adenylyltransferase
LELIRGKHNLRPSHRGCAVTIGNFDGLHLGHRAVLGRLVARARALGVPAVVMSFEPTPREYFIGFAAPPRLSSFREKYLGLQGQDVDRPVCARFDAQMASLAPEEFIGDYLVDGLGVRYLVIGDDFRFGRNRAGDLATLRAAGQNRASRWRTRRPVCLMAPGSAARRYARRWRRVTWTSRRSLLGAIMG